MLECKEASTPVECKLDIEKSETCDTEIPYQQLIGSLMYLAVQTRPDISFSVSFLSQFNKCHTNVHWKYAKRILRYLKKTKSFCLKYVKGETELVGYVDADWASNSVDRKSYTGYCFVLSGSAISWESRKQRTVALSSMEAEYMAIAEACKEAIYLRMLLCELTGNLRTVKLYNDSQSAQKLVANHVCHRKSKHIDIRYHFVKDVINDKVINLQYLPTTAMPADFLTKALSPMKHYKCIEGIGHKKAQEFSEKLLQMGEDSYLIDENTGQITATNETLGMEPSIYVEDGYSSTGMVLNKMPSSLYYTGFTLYARVDLSPNLTDNKKEIGFSDVKRVKPKYWKDVSGPCRVASAAASESRRGEWTA
ncbi:Copia protein [Eumeta japonica]|uniref:Copia protein n=1 Tax=Eumeta variegata TaxID=151549 RepID=A0A4C1WAD1_EUMVA|nr:Copia protein [Eumeta japonica]